MNDLNSVFVEGNLVKDPEIKQTAKGMPVCNFTIASNYSYKIEEEYEKQVDYFEVTAWSKTAEICAEKLKKGRGVRIIGKLKQNRWVDNEGKNRSKVIIIVNHIEFKPGSKNESIIK